MRRYIGWVPCVAGKLFFKHIKCGLGAYFGKIEINHVEKTGSGSVEIEPDDVTGLFSYDRYVILSSNVNWKDGEDGDGKFQVVLVGHATNSGDLNGNVYVILKKDTSSPQWKVIISKIKKLRGEIKKAKKAKNNISIKNTHAEINQELKKYDDGVCHKVEFELDRKGFAKLDYISKNNRDDLQKYTVCRQAFYYLKYSLHVHQHHNKGQDSLTTIHYVPKNPEDIGEQLLDDLKESMVAMKREHAANKYQRLFDNKGVNCYARSLLESCKSAGYMPAADYEMHKNYLNNLYGSMETTAEKTQRSIDSSNAASNASRSTLLLILGVMTPFLLINIDKIHGKVENILLNGLPFLLRDVVIQIATTTTGMMLTLFGFIMIFAFNHVRRGGRLREILRIKFVNNMASKILDDNKRGYIYAAILISISYFLYHLATMYK